MGHHWLGSEDAAWSRMEEATNPMVVSALVQLAQPLAPGDVDALAARLSAIPHFRDRLVGGLLPRWSPAPKFDARVHVKRVTLPTSGDAPLRSFIQQVACQFLNPAEPLWRIYAIDRPEGGTTLLFRIHHALADGFALLGALAALCDADPDSADGAVNRPHVASPPAAGGPSDWARALWRLAVLPPDPRTALKHELGLSKVLAWSAPLALSEVKRVANASGATVNDVLVATVAGALGRHLGRGSSCPPGADVRAMLPVNLRTAEEMTLPGNRFGFMMLSLPIAERDPFVRLALVKARTGALKSSAEARVAHTLLLAVARAPRAVRNALVSFFGKKTSLIVSNGAGPVRPAKMANTAITRIMFWVPQSARLGLGISLLSYAGQVTIGVLADRAVVADPEALVADLAAEFAALASGPAAARHASQPVRNGASPAHL